jgi:hypothetical protein
MPSPKAPPVAITGAEKKNFATLKMLLKVARVLFH